MATRPQDPVAYLNQPTVRPGGSKVLENAGALGYYVGALQAGGNAEAEDVKAQQDDVTAILKSASAVVAPFTGPIGGVVFSVGGEWINKGVQAAINDTSQSAANRLSLATLPQYTPDAPRPHDLERVPGPYLNEWNTQRTIALDFAEP